ncbi:hypothetical protein [Halegenticoccus soli]|uniref:hypothetical protein n=1 Tax=Halegenticoccus soli TaxID=1985678 RepID=UPI000C6EB0DC|nr:hypothetical protein [Halegenticoccus soli]
MTETGPRDPLAAFDEEVVEAVARDRGVATERLRELLRRQQESVRELPGVDDIVYEWRRAFPRNPLVERRDEAYFLAVPDHVWPEFGDALSLSSAELAALRAVHARQFDASLGGTDGCGDGDGTGGEGTDESSDGDGIDGEPIVLTRP